MSSKGNIFVISGPSGVGKGTVVKQLVENNDNIVVSVSATTRQPREGEVHGVNYYFLTKEEFQKMADEDGFLEHAVYCDNCYGTPKAPVFEKTEQGYDVILEIEVQGGIQVMEKFPQAVGIFILPPSYRVLEKRLRGRNSEKDEVVRKRLNTAREELKNLYLYDHFVVNGRLEDAVEDIKTIIKSYRD